MLFKSWLFCIWCYIKVGYIVFDVIVKYVLLIWCYIKVDVLYMMLYKVGLIVFDII